MMTSGGLGFAPGGSSWWQDLLQQGTDIGLSIAKARYGVPPPGTVIQTPTGTISTGVYPNPGAVLNTGVSNAGVPPWVWIAALAAVLLFMTMGRRK